MEQIIAKQRHWSRNGHYIQEAAGQNVKIGAFKASASSAIHLQVQVQVFSITKFWFSLCRYQLWRWNSAVWRNRDQARPDVCGVHHYESWLRWTLGTSW